MQSLLRNTQVLLLIVIVGVVNFEERLSWVIEDPEIRRSIFVPDDLPEGEEETRVLPLVFHSIYETKVMQIKCRMRGYNASNNPWYYQDALWIHPKFDESQVDTYADAEHGNEDGVPYAIWTMKITISSAKDAGKKWATCKWQQEGMQWKTDMKFLIFRPLSYSLVREESNSTLSLPEEAETVVLAYGLGEKLDEKDLTKQIEDDIKRQISDHYSLPGSSVSRPGGGQEFLITVKKEWVSDFIASHPHLDSEKGPETPDTETLDDKGDVDAPAPDADEAAISRAKFVGWVLLLSFMGTVLLAIIAWLLYRFCTIYKLYNLAIRSN